MGRSFRRVKQSIPERRTVCVVVEGKKTEKNYFIDAKAEFDQRREGILTVIAASGGSASQILDKSIKKATSEFDEVWCVLDADTFGANSADHQKLERAQRAKIKVIFSNPCFEVWHLLHFSNSHRSFHNCGKVKEAVEKRSDQFKSSKSMWHALREILNTGTPFENAAHVKKQHGIAPGSSCRENNCSTDVDEILIALGFGPSAPDRA
ncbi:MAG TPA: RloB family protein [Fimbriimonadaceae bacterium]|nr:RloB family protein [Fimbriimonadaceae bacterium]HRJ33274.1 RloB family protein [Fimbriimonadaceae bacterium]